MDTSASTRHPSTLVLFDGACLTDDALARLVRTSMRVIAVGPRENHDYLAYRWRAVGGAPDLVDGGYAEDLSGAVRTAVEHESVLIATPIPRHPIKAIHSTFAGLGEADPHEFPAVAIRFMRPHVVPGPTAVLADVSGLRGFPAHLVSAVAALPGQRVDQLALNRHARRRGLGHGRDLMDPDSVGRVIDGRYALAVQRIRDGHGTEDFLRPQASRGGHDSLADLASVLRLLREACGTDVVAVVENSAPTLHFESRSRVAVLPV